MKEFAISNLTKKINIVDFIENDKEKTLLIYSETSMKKNNIFINNDNYDCYSTREITKNQRNIDNMFTVMDYAKIISIGGGTAIDIGKYLAYKFKVKMVAVPAMLSTNAYATNKVALIVDDKVISLDAVAPTEVYFDDNILSNSAENNLFGMVDIFSIYTALNDWNLAIKFNNESIHKEYYNAESLLQRTIDYSLKNSVEEVLNDFEFIFKIIGESGLITNRYGSGKPESGSEHIFAKVLEKKVNIPHAVSVSNGLVLMILSQRGIENNFELNETDKKIISILDKFCVFELNKYYDISFDLISEAYMELEPRDDRFSVVNLIYKDDKFKKMVLEKYYEIMKGYLV